MISVVIPTRNAGSGFGALLESIRAQETNSDIEILVIDSGSRDDTVDVAQKSGAMVLSIPSREFSHGRARNQAIRASQGEFVILTVQDALPTNEMWAARLLDALIQDPDSAGSFGLQLAPANAGPLARARSLLWQEANCQPAVKAIAGLRDFEALSPDQRLELIRFDNVTACLRRSVWEGTPFQELSYGEDMAWARDVLLQGHRIAFVPEAQVWHVHERNPVYDLRRAYIHGRTRVSLVGWPTRPRLRLREALALLHRAASVSLATKLESVGTPAQVDDFLSQELSRCEPWDARAQHVYQAAIRFSRQLWDRTSQLYPNSILPRGVWKDIFRFAIVSVVGDRLGETAVLQQRQAAPGERVAWNSLHRALGRGI